MEKLVEKYSESAIKLNIPAIEADIQRAEALIEEKALSRTDLNKVKYVIKYLKRLESHIDTEGTYVFNWRLEDYELKAYPCQLRRFVINGKSMFRATDYIEANSGHIIYADYGKLFDAITYEIMYRDLGKSLQDIEEDLSDCGIAAIYPYEKLEKIIEATTDEMDLWGKSLRIGDSPYATKDGKMSFDYFGSVAREKRGAFTSGKYKDCVSRSVNIATLIIANNIMNICMKKKINFQICSVGEGGFYFMLDANEIDNDTIEELLPSVAIQVFGRKFEVVPNRAIY
jgi:hypothetical protein